jgi:hypothetical protein
MPSEFSQKIQRLAVFLFLAAIASRWASALPASHQVLQPLVKRHVVYNGLAE